MTGADYNYKKLQEWREEKARREGREITQEALARDLGVHRNTVVRAENGLTCTYGFLCQLGLYYGKRIKPLLYEPTQKLAQAA